MRDLNTERIISRFLRELMLHELLHSTGCDSLISLRWIQHLRPWLNFHTLVATPLLTPLCSGIHIRVVHLAFLWSMISSIIVLVKESESTWVNIFSSITLAVSLTNLGIPRYILCIWSNGMSNNLRRLHIIFMLELHLAFIYLSYMLAADRGVVCP